MRLFDLENSAQNELTDTDLAKKDDTPAFDKTKFGNSMFSEKRDLDEFDW